MVRQLESFVVAFLSTTQQLLPPAGFVDGINSLLAHPDSKVRHRVLTLFKDMLQSPSAGHHTPDILAVLPILRNLLQRRDPLTADDEGDETETAPNKQLVLICTGLLCKMYGTVQPESFTPLVPVVAEAALHKNLQLASSALLCMASLGAQFGPLLLPHLSVLVERLLSGLDIKQLASRGDRSGTAARHPPIPCAAPLTFAEQPAQSNLGGEFGSCRRGQQWQPR